MKIEIVVPRMEKPRFKRRDSKVHPVKRAVGSLNKPLEVGSMRT